jgi:hypothetical protein
VESVTTSNLVAKNQRSSDSFPSFGHRGWNTPSPFCVHIKTLFIDVPAEERDAMGRCGCDIADQRFSTVKFESAVSSFVESAAVNLPAHRASI